MGDTNIKNKVENSTEVSTEINVSQIIPDFNNVTTKKTNWFLENIVLVVILGVVSSIIASFII